MFTGHGVAAPNGSTSSRLGVPILSPNLEHVTIACGAGDGLSIRESRAVERPARTPPDHTRWRYTPIPPLLLLSL